MSKISENCAMITKLFTNKRTLIILGGSPVPHKHHVKDTNVGQSISSNLFNCFREDVQVKMLTNHTHRQRLITIELTLRTVCSGELKICYFRIHVSVINKYTIYSIPNVHKHRTTTITEGPPKCLNNRTFLASNVLRVKSK